MQKYVVSSKARNRGILSLVIIIGAFGGLLWRNSHLTRDRSEISTFNRGVAYYAVPRCI